MLHKKPTREPDGGALARVSPDEFELKPDYDGIWLTINNISLRVRRTDEGVDVRFYALNDENSDALAESFVTFAEATPSDTA